MLVSAECLALADAVRAEVVDLEAQAGAIVLSDPTNLLMHLNDGLPDESMRRLIRASRLQIFLDVLSEVSQAEHRFRTAKLSIFSKTEV